MLRSSKTAVLTSGVHDSFAHGGFANGRKSRPTGIHSRGYRQGVVSHSPPPLAVAKPRLVIGRASTAIDYELDVASRVQLDRSAELLANRLGRVLRCCLFGKLWANEVEREGRAVYGKVKVPRGLVTGMVKAFCALEGRGRG